MCSMYFLYKSSKHQLRPVLSSGARKIRNLHEKFAAQPQLKKFIRFYMILACVSLYQIRVIIDVSSIFHNKKTFRSS